MYTPSLTFLFQGLLSEDEIRRRVAQFVALGAPVVVSRAPLFTHKAALLPGSRFVVGYDTAVRLVLPKYYNNSYTQMLLDFSRFITSICMNDSLQWLRSIRKEYNL